MKVPEGMAAGRARAGPLTVHVDIVHACNARCVSCWDHSPLLLEPRSADWKRIRMDLGEFDTLTGQLDAFGSVRGLILSGMGEPLVHPDAYEMMARVKARGWHLTLISNLLAADMERLAASRVDQVLVGIHGVSPESYAAFHEGWDEGDFMELCRRLRLLGRAGIRQRHVQVITRGNARELPEMIRFGGLFRAERVNFKLAALGRGTERCAITREQREWLLGEGIAVARDDARRIGVATNLDLFRRQVEAGATDARITTPMAETGCLLGWVYARVGAESDLLYCCNTATRMGSLRDASFASLWYGDAWQALRERLARGEWLPGCETCGKFEQNRKWRERATRR